MRSLARYLTKEQIEEIRNLDQETVERHFKNPLYVEAERMAQEVRGDQIVKGAKKYPEPLNSKSWTPKELIRHAFDENIDQQHYLVALSEKMEQLELELKTSRDQAEYWRLKAAASKEDHLKLKVHVTHGQDQLDAMEELRKFYERAKGSIIDERA